MKTLISKAFNIQTVNIPKINMLGMHAEACRLGELEFSQTNACPATWFIATTHRYYIMVTPWEDANQKENTIEFVRILIDIFDAHAYTLMMQVQITEDVDSPVYDEILLINTVHKGHTKQRPNYLTSQYLVNNRYKHPFLGPRIDDPYQAPMEPNIYDLEMNTDMMLAFMSTIKKMMTQ